MIKKIMTEMFVRRRFLKRMFLLLFMSGVTLYAIVLLFGDIQTPNIMTLTNLDRCPACYGVSVCPELYSSQITLDRHNHWTQTFFNVKNVFYGSTKSNRRVVLKKLAHDWELAEFDKTLCKEFDLQKDCKVSQLLNVTGIENRIKDIVSYNISWPEAEPRKGLIMCPYPNGIFEFLEPALSKTRNRKSDLLNIWTILKINPEPIILQVIPKSQGWRVPAYAGVCGRLEMVGYEGESLYTMKDLVPWHKKLKYAQKIIEAALDFTYKHERFRFYLMDWSLDNIVVNKNDEISFIDLEDIVVLDKHITPNLNLEEWYKRYTRDDLEPGFTFSIDNLCRFHLSDHNIWAACYTLAGEDTALLLPIPKSVNTTRPLFEKLLYECVNNNEKRFLIVNTLKDLISDMLLDDKVVSSGDFNAR